MSAEDPSVAGGATERGDLAAFGWDAGHANAFERLAADLARDGEPGRVVVEERGRYVVRTASGECPATVTGRFRWDADEAEAFPAVGDWVLLERSGDAAVLHAVLPRRTAVVRRAPSDHATPTQVVAANVDVLFVMTSLDHDLKLRRLERYLAVAWESGARPIVLLSKADVATDRDASRLAVEEVAPGVPVHVVSAYDGTGMDDVARHLGEGRTAAVVGSSGVGKSTLINALLGEERLATRGVREDDSRGRHTTTRRQLIRLDGDAPGGATGSERVRGLIVDTPGMRELALADDGGLEQAFDDIASLAAGCRFTDCRHDTEPGCAVRDALRDGRLEAKRLAAWRKLGREAASVERRRDALARIEERRRWKAITKSVARHMKAKYGDD